MGAEFFDGLEVGACFRYEIAGTLTFSSGVESWQRWVLAEYRGRGPRDEVLFVVWDSRHHESNRDWKLGEIPERLERFDPTVTEEHLATEVWLNQLRDAPYLRSRMTYVPSGWTLGDLVRSSWVNIHTHEIVGNCQVDLDRFGQPQLFIVDRHDELTLWLEVDGVSRPVIEHWDRWDVMGHEEQAHRAALRVVRLQKDLTQAASYPLTRKAYANELEMALRQYHSLSNGAVIPLEVLNVGRGAGEQLALL